MIVATHVFAGTAELTRPGHRDVLEAGEEWVAPATVQPTPRASLDAFRIGWEALRDKRYADAIEALDRASDPVVAEDAVFWAAIACERAGDLPAATARLQAFIAHFPDSPRLDAAHAALERVSH